MVSSSPWSRENLGFQFQSDWASFVPASSRSTSLEAGRTRSESVLTSIARPISVPIRSTSSPIEMSSPRPMLTARPKCLVARGDRDEALHGVLDKGQVAAGVEPAKLDHGSGERLADDGRNDRAGRLAGAEGVERPENRYRKSKRTVIALAQGVGCDLGRGVGRLAPERVLLVDGHVLRGAIDLGRRRQYDSLQSIRASASVEDVRRAQNIRLHHVVRVLVRVGNGDQGTQMENPFARSERPSGPPPGLSDLPG